MPSLQELYDEYLRLPPLSPAVNGRIAAEPEEAAGRRNALLRRMIQAGKAEAAGVVRKFARHADVEGEIAYQLHVLLVEKRVQERGENGPQNFPSLLKMALVRRLIDEWRSERRRGRADAGGSRHVDLGGAEGQGGPGRPLAPDEEADRKDTARQIAAAWWERLKNRPRARETYLLVHCGAEAGAPAGEEDAARPYKLREAAEVLGIPVGTVKSRLADAGAVMDRLVQSKIRDRDGELLYSPRELSGLLREIPRAIQEQAGVRDRDALMALASGAASGRSR